MVVELLNMRMRKVLARNENVANHEDPSITENEINELEKK
jgi:hypothetical protein